MLAVAWSEQQNKIKTHASRALPLLGIVLVISTFLLLNPDLSTAPRAFAQSETAFVRNLTIGSSGPDVATLQSALISKGFLSVPAPTGYFGAKTSAALAAWQGNIGLPATGFFGPMSRTALGGPLALNTTGNAVNTGSGAVLGVATSPIPAPTATTATFSRDLTVGDSGADVSSVQLFLITYGFLSTAKPTGYFGPLTASALAKWQSTKGIPATGYFGPLSRAAMQALLAPSPAPTPASSQLISFGGGGGGGGGGSPAPAPAPAPAPTPAPAPDTVVPGVSIFNPSNNSTVSGTITVEMNASDNVGVAKVEFYVDGSLKSSVSAAPYKFSLDTSGLSSGSHTLTGKAYDAAGNSAVSSGVAITIASPSSPSTSGSSNPASLNYKFGLSVGENLLGLNSSALNAALDDIVSLHVGWLRFDIEWDHIQGAGSGSYDWSRVDAFVAAANAHHIKLLALLSYTPSWARSPSCSAQTDRCPPADPAAFAAFAKTVVTRYAPLGLHAWEIWNEPNFPSSWEPGANPAAYAALLKATYPAIKSVQPLGVVITGGLAPAASTNGALSPTDFLSQLYADGAKPYFDAVGFHPYSFPAEPTNFQPWNAWSQIADTQTSMRSVMAANGDADKRLWLTEYGAPTGGPGSMAADGTLSDFGGSPDHVTEDLQAQMLTEAIQTVSGFSWEGPMFWYSYKDIGTSQSTNENFFGLLRNDGSAKPAYAVMKNLLGAGL